MRRRIALIRNSYAHDVGGAEKFPYLVAGALNLEKYEPVVVSANSRTRGLAASYSVKSLWSPWLKFQNFSGIRIVLLPLYILWQCVLIVWYFIFFLVNRFDVIHAQSRDDFIAATLAGRLLRRKIIWTDHADLKYVFANYAVWYKNPVGKIVFWCSRFAYKVTLVSNNEKVLVAQSYGKELPTNYTVVYNGVADAFAEYPHIESKVVRFSATSRLVYAKGIAELIKAFKEVTGNVELHLYGDGQDEQSFKKIAAGDDRINFHGFTADIYDVLASTDVFVHPSYNEGFSVSIVEAAMMAKPIIACSVGGNPEIVTDGLNGRLVTIKNAPELTIAMQEFVNNPELINEFGENSRKTYLASFNFEEIVKNNFEKFYA